MDTYEGSLAYEQDTTQAFSNNKLAQALREDAVPAGDSCRCPQCNLPTYLSSVANGPDDSDYYEFCIKGHWSQIL